MSTKLAIEATSSSGKRPLRKATPGSTEQGFQMRIERRGKSLVVLCTCCDLPFARLQFGRLVIQSKHYSDNHWNSLSPEDLESILELLRKADAIMPIVPRR